MKPITPLTEKCLLILAILGFLVPNGIFVYFILFDFPVVSAAHRNPVSAAFIGEAIFLMLLFAWFFPRQDRSPVGSGMFLILTLLGSLAFSVPFYFFLYSRSERQRHHATPANA